MSGGWAGKGGGMKDAEGDARIGGGRNLCQSLIIIIRTSSSPPSPTACYCC